MSQFASENKVWQDTPASYAFITLAHQEAAPDQHTVFWIVHLAHLIKRFYCLNLNYNTMCSDFKSYYLPQQLRPNT